MKAVWYRRTGSASQVLEYGEIGTPTPRPGELLVRIAASGINPSDVKQRSGLFRFGPEAERTIPHQDGAGTVVNSGDGPDDPMIGRRVWLFFTQVRRAFGTAAEFAIAERQNVGPLPDHASFDQGACLGVPALTAHAALTAVRPTRSEWILVQGGAGAVGGYAIQFAKDMGARVIASVSSPEKAAIAAGYGADHVLCYTEPSFENEVLRMTDDRGVDRIVEVDFGANVAADVRMLAQHGVIVSYSSPRVPEPALPYYPLAMKTCTVSFVQIYRMPRPVIDAAVRAVQRLLETGTLKHRIAHQLPLSQTVRAHEIVEEGNAVGKTIVNPP